MWLNGGVYAERSRSIALPSERRLAGRACTEYQCATLNNSQPVTDHSSLITAFPKMKKIYCISGLGSDEKVFAKIKVDGYDLVPIAWLPPEKKESIEAYAKRMGQTIADEKPILMGLSFGGMMSIEISKLLPVEKVILISSVKSYKEMPLWMRGAGKLQLNKIIPMHPYPILEPIQNYKMGVTNKEEKEMVRRYRQNISQPLLSWSVNKILNWKNDWQPNSIFHIHGDADRIFPVKNIRPDYFIKGGGHFMVYNQAAEINRLLQLILKN